MSDNDVKPNPGFIYKLGLVLLAFMFGVLGSVIMSWCMSKVYGWFVVDSLGPGPTLEGWFGIAVLVHLAIIGPLANVKRKDDGDGVAASFVTIFGLTMASLIIVGGAYLTGLVCGWV